MAMKDKVIVLGANQFDGTIDGTKYHQGKLRVLGNSDDKDTEKGLAQVIYKCAYELVDTLNVFPAVYEIEVEPLPKGFYVSSAKLVGEKLKLPVEYRC